MIDTRRKPLHIGLSARIFHPQVGATGIQTKTLQVLEQSIAQWAAERGVLVVMVPSVLQDGALLRSSIRLRDYAEYLDGLILQGGADVSPGTYGESPLRSEWAGDPVRDAYELELLREFMAARKPVLGICRGMQLINVALGGSLTQDLPSLRPGGVAHESSDYDQHSHRVLLNGSGSFARWFGGCSEGRVISIHHQAIDRLGREVAIEATAEDGVIEAIRWTGKSFVVGVQWHPEFHHLDQEKLLDCAPLLDAFLAAARAALDPG